MKKILNFRPLFYCFIAFLSAILFAPYLFKTNWLYLVLFIILIFGLLILSILRNKIIQYLLILIFITIGFTSYFIEASTYNVKNYNNEVFITARVASEKQNDTYQSVILDNISLNGNNIEEKIYIYSYGTPILQVGDIITFSKKLKTINAFYENGNFSSFYYKNNIRYTATISASSIQIIESRQTLSDKIHLLVKEKLLKHMSYENAAIAYASLLGDKNAIDIQVANDYRDSGISHILSISGLHISILVGLLFLILNKLKSPKILSFTLISLILFLYCYLCGFSPSVLRASIMNICFLGAGVMGQKYDSLSAIGLAGLIMLLFFPFSAYDIGFQLSFASVIGIAFFYKSLNNFFRKIKFPKFLASSFAISISAQFFIMPILINAFGGASVFSVLINILVVPLFTLAYIVLFILTPLVFLFDFLGRFLWISDFLFQCINTCANFVASLKWSIIPKMNLSLIIATFFYIGVFISSRFVFIQTKNKIIINSILSVLIIIFLGLSQLTQIVV